VCFSAALRVKFRAVRINIGHVVPPLVLLTLGLHFLVEAVLAEIFVQDFGAWPIGYLFASYKWGTILSIVIAVLSLLFRGAVDAWHRDKMRRKVDIFTQTADHVSRKFADKVERRLVRGRIPHLHLSSLLCKIVLERSINYNRCIGLVGSRDQEISMVHSDEH